MGFEVNRTLGVLRGNDDLAKFLCESPLDFLAPIRVLLGLAVPIELMALDGLLAISWPGLLW